MIFDFDLDTPFEVDGLTVTVSQDDLAWDLMGDGQVDIIGRASWRRFWNLHCGGADVPDYETLMLIYEEDWPGLLSLHCYDFEERETGVVVYSDGYDDAITFKTIENAARRMFERKTGHSVNDIKIEEISPQYHQSSDSFYVVWNQKQLDRYAGCKNANAFVETYQSILSGDVFHVSVSDESEKYHDSLGGIIGEYWSEYVSETIRECVDNVKDDMRRDKTSRLKELIRNHVPLEVRAVELGV